MSGQSTASTDCASSRSSSFTLNQQDLVECQTLASHRLYLFRVLVESTGVEPTASCTTVSTLLQRDRGRDCCSRGTCLCFCGNQARAHRLNGSKSSNSFFHFSASVGDSLDPHGCDIASIFRTYSSLRRSFCSSVRGEDGIIGNESRD